MKNEFFWVALLMACFFVWLIYNAVKPNTDPTYIIQPQANAYDTVYAVGEKQDDGHIWYYEIGRYKTKKEADSVVLFLYNERRKDYKPL